MIIKPQAKSSSRIAIDIDMNGNVQIVAGNLMSLDAAGNPLPLPATDVMKILLQIVLTMISTTPGPERKLNAVAK